MSTPTATVKCIRPRYPPLAGAAAACTIATIARRPKRVRMRGDNQIVTCQPRQRVGEPIRRNHSFLSPASLRTTNSHLLFMAQFDSFVRIDAQKHPIHFSFLAAVSSATHRAPNGADETRDSVCMA